MSRLRIGDLVYVVRAPCGCSSDNLMGYIEKILKAEPGWWCPRCGHHSPLEMAYHLPTNNGGFCRPAWCLRKIPPLEELDGQTSQERLVNPFKAEAKRRHAEQDREAVLK